MNPSVDSESPAASDENKSIGVRFAESTVGAPIVAGLLFIANSFWLLLTTTGVVLTLVAIAMWDGVMAGVIGVFGLSAIGLGLFGYIVVLWYVSRSETRS
ncbi:hypothetical protein OB919_04460 [Halobacteria archaeon AArc-curdl1]|uniref:Uncharacterized protein n=1 Tax=Natronosalvus hydrolyticus TaxID=2979988 RepID=A0AAP3E5P7_9EURY|nr:hypothetical protein [Halobacteria archaeon AArc-curdl1]